MLLHMFPHVLGRNIKESLKINTLTASGLHPTMSQANRLRPTAAKLEQGQSVNQFFLKIIALRGGDVKFALFNR